MGKTYAKQHPAIKFWWCDYWSMPQEWAVEIDAVPFRGKGKLREKKVDSKQQNYVQYAKNDIEASYFKKSLGSINFLYLGTEVLILLDKDYFRRFWCLLEAYLAFHVVDEKKALVMSQGEHLVLMGSTKGQELYAAAIKQEVDKPLDGPEGFLEWLKSTDIAVTNAGDKDLMINKMHTFKEDVEKSCGVQDLRLPQP